MFCIIRPVDKPGPEVNTAAGIANLLVSRLVPGRESSEAEGMTTQPAAYPRHRFPAEIISHAVWLYHVLVSAYETSS
jgi:hypothetical protein